MNRNRMLNERAKQRWALRKLTVGLSSVLLGMTFMGLSGRVEAATQTSTPKDEISEKESADVDQKKNDLQTTVTAEATTKQQETKQADQNVSASIAKPVGENNKEEKTGAVTTKPVDSKPQTKKISQSNSEQTNSTAATKTAETDQATAKSQDKLTDSKLPAKADQEEAAGKQDTSKLDTLKTAAKKQAVASDLKDKKEATAQHNVDLDLWQTTGTAATGLEITGYNPSNDQEKTEIVVPNSVDFIKAGKLNEGQSLSISSQTVHNIVSQNKPTYFGISHTADSHGQQGKVVAKGSDWSNAFSNGTWHYVDEVDPNLTEIDFANLDTKSVMHFNWAFAGASKLTTIDVSGWDTSNVTDLGQIFYKDKALKKIIGIENWNVNRVITLCHAFQDCSSLTSIDLSGWRPGSAYPVSDSLQFNNISSMFANDSQLESVGDLSNWNTSNVKDFHNAFSGCSKLANLNLNNWDVSKANNFTSMFDGLATSTATGKLSLKNWKLGGNVQNMFKGLGANVTIDLSGWNTKQVTDMSYMFANCGGLKNIIGLNDLDTSHVTNMAHMFENCTDLIDLSQLEKWVTNQVINMNSMFAGCTQLADISGVSNWNVSLVRDFSNMFSNCTSLTDVNLSTWKTNSLSSFDNMFGNDTALINVDLSNWNTSKLGGLSNMFSSCQNIENLTLNGWDLSKFESWSLKSFIKGIFAGNKLQKVNLKNWKLGNNLNGLFQGVNSPAAIDLSGWDTKQATDMSYMFSNCGSMKNIVGLNSFDTSNVTNMAHMFENCTGLTDLSQLKEWVTSKVTNMNSMFSGCAQLTDISALTNWDVSLVSDFAGMFSNCTSLIDVDLSNWKTNSLTTFDNMFGSDTALKQVNLSNWNTSNLASLNNMFGYCSNIETLNLSGWDLHKFDAEGIKNFIWAVCSDNKLNTVLFKDWNVSQITDMSGWFDGFSSSVKTLNLSGWKTDSLQFLEWTFGANASLINLDLSGWNTSNLSDMGNLFDSSTSLVTIKGIDQWDTSKVTMMNFVFHGASSLQRLDLSKWDVSQVITTSHMFQDCHSLQSVGKLDKWKLGKDRVLDGMFQDCSNLTEVGHLDDWDVSSAGYDAGALYGYGGLDDMFAGCSSLTDIGNLDNWDISNVTALRRTFQNCSNLTNVGNLSKWNTSKVTSLDSTFMNCSKLTSIGDLSNWDTSSVTYMGDTFHGAASLTSVGDLKNWDTSNVTMMNYMFDHAESLKHLDLSKWNVGQVTTFNHFLADCYSLTSVGDLSNWDVSHASIFAMMFGTDLGNNADDLIDSNVFKQNQGSLQDLGDLSNWDVSNAITLNSMFCDQVKLTNVGDLSHWKTGKVGIFSYMFANCQALKSIGKLDNWDLSHATDTRGMFWYAVNLTNIGDLSHWQTGNDTNMAMMFAQMPNVKSLGDLSGWDVSKVTTFNSMFFSNTASTVAGNGHFSALQSLGNLGKWNVGSAYDMSAMFGGADSLTSLGDLSHWQTGKVLDMSAMFSGCTSLSSIGHLDNWDVSNVEYANEMFSYTPKLTNIGDLSRWKTDKVADTSYMFADTGLPVINVNNWNLSNDRNFNEMFSYLPHSAVIEFNNVTLPADSVFDNDEDKDFHAPSYNTFGGQQPLIVISNVPEIEALNDKPAYWLSKDDYPDFIGHKGNVAVDKANSQIKLQIPVKFVYQNQADLQQELNNKLSYANIKAALAKLYDQADTPQNVKDLIGVGGSNLLDPKITVNAADIMADPSKLSTALNLELKFKVTSHYIKYEFVDTDNNNAVVGEPVTVSGITGAKVNLTLPENYELANDQNVLTFTDDDSVDATKPTLVKIKIKHQTAQVTNSNQWNDVGVASEDQKDLTKSISRTIHFVNDQGKDLEGHNPITQTVKFKRTAIIDKVTKKVIGWVDPSGASTTTTEDKAWTIDGKGTWDAVTVPLISGYKSVITLEDGTKLTEIAEHAVDANQDHPETIRVSYSAAQQSVEITYVDDNQGGAQVETITKNGTTGQSINLSLHVPAKYELAAGQTLPATYTFTADNAPIVIHLVHGTEDVTNDPSEEANVKKTVTYKVVESFNGVETTVVDKSATFTRTATKDMVTGAVSYGDWTGDAVAVDAQDVSKAGYTAQSSDVSLTNGSVPAYTITAGSGDKTIRVSYRANGNHPTPEIQTARISINVQDNNGHVVTAKEFETTGHVGEYIEFGHNNSEVRDWINNFLLSHPDYYLAQVPEVPAAPLMAAFMMFAARPSSMTPAPKAENNSEGISLDSLNWPTLFGKFTNGQNVRNFELLIKQKAAPSDNHNQGGSENSGQNSSENTGHDVHPSVPTQQSIVARLVDDDQNEQQIGKAVVLQGIPGQTVQVLLTMPKFYQLAAGQTWPNTYTFKADNNYDLTIHLVHMRRQVSETKVENNSGKAVELQRNGSQDLTNGQINWGNWFVVDQTATPTQAVTTISARRDLQKPTNQNSQEIGRATVDKHQKQSLPQTGNQDDSALGVGLAVGASLLGLAGYRKKHEN